MSHENNLPNEEKKKILPEWKNRGAKMGDLERNLENMLYNEEHQWLFLEESSDGDFDPHDKSNDNNDNEGNEDNEDSEWDEACCEGNEENDDVNNDDKKMKKRINIQKFLLNKKRGPTPITDEIYELNQLDIEKIDKFEDERIFGKRKTKRRKRKLKSCRNTQQLVITNDNNDGNDNNLKEDSNKENVIEKKRPIFLIKSECYQNDKE